MPLNELNRLAQGAETTEEMPALFLGHGSPMNAIEDNEFTRGWRELGAALPRPKAVLCVSAHWETNGTHVTAMPRPEAIHDFGGFPRALYEEKYPAPGSPELAREVKEAIESDDVGLHDKWGLDHGAWSVLKHIFPAADVPVVQLSLDQRKSPRAHFELAKELAPLRRKGVLIIGSGNMVHNLRLVAWNKLGEVGYAFDWAAEAGEKMKSAILSGDADSLVNYGSLGKEVELAVPTPEHFLPLLYALALKREGENLSLFNDRAVGGSLTMTCVKIGQ